MFSVGSDDSLEGDLQGFGLRLRNVFVMIG